MFMSERFQVLKDRLMKMKLAGGLRYLVHVSGLNRNLMQWHSFNPLLNQSCSYAPSDFSILVAELNIKFDS
jgi:hypothetical protein